MASRRPSARATTAALLIFGICGARAAEPPATQSNARGEHIAQNLCSTCHIVAKEQQFPPILDPPAPSFLVIANRPGVSTESVRRFIVSTHWDTRTLPMRMPSTLLTDEQIDEVARYLMSLRAQ